MADNKKKSFVSSILQRSEMNETTLQDQAKPEVTISSRGEESLEKEKGQASPTVKTQMNPEEPKATQKDSLNKKKNYTTQVHLDTITKLKRLAYWLPGGSETGFVNQALEEFFANHPELHEALDKATPKE
jgi:hypothetical protein